jgi:hypothetical protein
MANGISPAWDEPFELEVHEKLTPGHVLIIEQDPYGMAAALAQ